MRYIKIRSAYYNEHDPYAARWLRNLIAAGKIAPGDVDERSVVDVRADDLKGYGQCHFFAGIGGWAYALRLAGWPDSRPVWTGSCPCQSLSTAARGRHTAPDLWPAWVSLIAASRPGTVFGEQVTGKSIWFDRACNDLDGLGYALGAAILPAVAVGADHARSRIYFVGHAYDKSQSSRAVDAKMVRVSKRRSNPGGVVSSDGVPDRVAVMRAFGNAVVPQVAAEFISATQGG